jgi:type I restriction enzyme S subunit
MKKYNNYKDSGIEWIGEIPQNWEYSRLKLHSLSKTGTTPSRDNEEYWQNGNIPWMSSGEINQRIIKVVNSMVTEKAYSSTSLTLFPKGSLVIAMNGQGKTKGMVGILDIETSFNQSITAFKFDDSVSCKYIYYFIDSKYFDLRGLVGEDREGLSSALLKNIYFPLPPLKEQTAIANYLDHKTTQIENLITQKEQFITLLQEERTAVINQAVTKGLDPNVKMKDSGIEWLGEIPEHWEVKSFRFCIDVLTDYTANGSFASLAENVTYLDSGYSRLVRLTDLRVNLENEGLYVDENAHKFLKKSELFGGELLIANVGAYAGLVKLMPYLKGKYTLAPNMFLLRLNQNTLFFHYQLNAPFCNEQLKIASVSSAQPKLNKDNIRQLKVVVPPLNEQELLLKQIEKECSQIDLILSNCNKEIELLKEYKTALISEVVTGKVDVRDVVLN